MPARLDFLVQAGDFRAETAALRMGEREDLLSAPVEIIGDKRSFPIKLRLGINA